MTERFTDQIEWDGDLHEIYENDIDGHGTREGLVLGFIRTPKGTYEYSATASQGFPYDELEIQESTIEETGFAPAEPDGAE